MLPKMEMPSGGPADSVGARLLVVHPGVRVPDRAEASAAGRTCAPSRRGEACASCGQPLTVIKGIEVGHIFKLGYKYSDALDITVSGPDGKPVRPIMGYYGIGVERAIATGDSPARNRSMIPTKIGARRWPGRPASLNTGR